MTFAAALFAMTLNFLQPPAHAFLMRNGGMGSPPWTSMCLPNSGTDDEQSSGQAAATPLPSFWNDTGHTQPNRAATLIDIGLTWLPAKDVVVYGSIQNLANYQYLASGYSLTSFQGTTVNASAIPAMGPPLAATVGIRVRL